ncbi:MAG: DUF2726 domain-containing protein [Defluviitaleaceae bacterium]|nr:DUF2726 domain-containing protein [Defluviitaleaceae bacterium]
MEILTISFFLLYVVVFAYLAKNKTKNRKYKKQKLKKLNTKYSYSLEKSLLTKKELDFFKIIKPIIDDIGLYVAIKPRIADFIRIFPDDKTENFWINFKKISQKHVDFLICDFNFTPIIAIELDDITHLREDRKNRDFFVDNIYKDVNLKVLHFTKYNSYNIEKEIFDITLNSISCEKCRSGFYIYKYKSNGSFSCCSNYPSCKNVMNKSKFERIKNMFKENEISTKRAK